MTRRLLCVRVGPPTGERQWRRALLEDVLEVLVGVPGVEVALVVPATGPHAVEARADAEAVSWPSTPVVAVDPGDPGDHVTLAGLVARERGADEVTLVAPDAPDLPPLLLGKAARALSAPLPPGLAVVPARDGSLVALALRLPAPGWAIGHGLDGADALARLRAAAPAPAALAVTPGWHRLAGPDDAHLIDPRQDGAERTRALVRP